MPQISEQRRVRRGRRPPCRQRYGASLCLDKIPKEGEDLMSETVGAFLVKRLSEWGVKRIFGYPGDGITGIMGALHRAGNDPELLQVRHEEMASFMACAHSKFTGEVGVCLATSGPGAIHLLNGLYDAKMDHRPVVAIVGQQALASLGGDYQQEVDLVSLYKDVANEYVQVLADPTQARHLLDRAFRIAKAERTVTCLVVPYDVQELEAVEQPPHAHGSIFSGVGYSEPRVVPHEADLRRAAELLNSGERVAILVGAGASGATDEVIEVADVLGAGVSKALLGMAAVPDDLPFVTGGIGPIGREPSWDLMMGCDTLLMVGSGMPYTEYMPQPGQARGVQIDIDGRMLSLRYPMEVNLVGDSAETLRALLPHLRRKADRTWREEIEGKVRRFWGIAGERAKTDADPLNPMRVFWDLSERLPDGCILTGDSGSVVSWMCQAVRLRRGMMWSLSGGLATMGSGVPYAIAAKFAYPDRPVIALVGDGAMQMNGNSELLTVANHWARWDDPRLVVLVLNNRDLLCLLGAALRVRRPPVPRFAEAARLSVRRLRGASGYERHPRQEARGRCESLGRGPLRRPARGARSGHRPRRAAAAAFPRQARAGGGFELRARSGRLGG